MEWEDKVKLVELGNETKGCDKTAFLTFVIKKIDSFDTQTYDMFLTLIEFIPAEFTEYEEFHKIIYTHMVNINPNRLGFRAEVRFAIYMKMCEDNLNIR